MSLILEGIVPLLADLACVGTVLRRLKSTIPIFLPHTFVIGGIPSSPQRLGCLLIEMLTGIPPFSE
jgi:hypothetical protein